MRIINSVENIKQIFSSTYTFIFAGVIILSILLLLIGAYFTNNRNKILGTVIILVGCGLIITSTILYIFTLKEEEKHRIKAAPQLISQEEWHYE